MPAEVDGNAGLQIGHILFLDIVGYSKLLTNEQRERVAALTQVVREWTTLDLILNSTFVSPAPPHPGGVAGYSKDVKKPVASVNGKAEIVSTAGNSPNLWREWLKNTTITLGINNVFNLQPPFVTGATAAGWLLREWLRRNQC